MNNDITTIKLKNGKLLRLRTDFLDQDIDTEGLLKIDLANIAAEIVTIPVALHKIGVLLSECGSMLSKAKFDLQIFEAKKQQSLRQEKIDNKEKYTIDSINCEMRSSKSWRIFSIKVIDTQRQYDYMNSLYWSLKSKDDKINKLSMSMQTGDVLEQLINTKIRFMNGVNIDVVRPLGY
jgi:hypothetical protein